MGASKLQIVTKVLLREALPQLVQGLSITMIMLVGYSAMAGLMGGGGLGDIAIRYGYYRYNYTIMYYALIILIILVEVIQTSIGLVVKHIDKRNK
jgi:D-methionine transport system permease protein